VLRGRAVAGAATLTLIRGARVPLAPPLTLQQARLARELARARGAAAPAEPEELARTVGPELGLALATGLVARGLVRRLPVRNRLVEAAVAAAGTAIVATAARRLPS
jgi:hypothetical protein